MKQKPAPCVSPAALSAASALLGPGSGTTVCPAAAASATSTAPGSLMAGVPASLMQATDSPRRQTLQDGGGGFALVVGVQSQQRLLQPQVAEQLRANARVFTGHGIHPPQHVHRAQRDVGQVADGCGHHIQRAVRIMLRRGCFRRGGQG